MPIPASTSPVPTQPLWLRLLHSAAAIALAIALTLIVAIGVVGLVPAAHAAFESLISRNPDASHIAVGVMLGLIVLLPLTLIIIAARRRWLTWPVLAAGALLTLPVLAWLAWDEPAIRQPLPIEELSPPFPGAEKSFAVLMRYSKHTSDPEAKAYDKVKLATQWTAPATRDPLKWREWVLKNRATLEADWATLAPQRAWFEELAAFDRIGDLTPASLDADIMKFQIWRTLSQRTCTIATLQAIDGERDAAIATLLPMLQTSRRLQLSSRTAVRTMIAVVIERMTMETATLILDLGTVAPATLARLDTALAGENGPALARRLLLIEYAQFAPIFGSMKLGDQLQIGSGHRTVLRRPLNLLSALFFNPNATTNLYGVRVYELAALAEARELGKFNVRSKGFDDLPRREPGMKNLAGRLLLNMAVPAYEKMVDSHWKTADLRAALRKQVAARTTLAKS